MPSLEVRSKETNGKTEERGSVFNEVWTLRRSLLIGSVEVKPSSILNVAALGKISWYSNMLLSLLSVSSSSFKLFSYIVTYIPNSKNLSVPCCNRSLKFSMSRMAVSNIGSLTFPFEASSIACASSRVNWSRSCLSTVAVFFGRINMEISKTLSKLITGENQLVCKYRG